MPVSATVSTADRSLASLDLARNCGADLVVKADGNEVQTIKDLTGGHGAEAHARNRPCRNAFRMTSSNGRSASART